MKIIHNQYKSYPLVKWAAEQVNIERFGELRCRITHGLGRLKGWEHLELCGYKIDEFETSEIIKQIRHVIRTERLGSHNFVIRAEVNVVRVWRIPKSPHNWQNFANKALDLGAVIEYGHIEYMAAAHRPDALVEKTYLNDLEDESEVST